MSLEEEVASAIAAGEEGDIVAKKDGSEVFKTILGEYPISIENGKSVYRINGELYQVPR